MLTGLRNAFYYACLVPSYTSIKYRKQNRRENFSFFLSFFLQVWPAVLLCRRTPTYYGRIVVKILYTPAPFKNCAAFKNVCIHQCVQKCVYMYIVRTRFYTIFYIVSKRKQNDQFSLKGLKKFVFSVKNVRFRFNTICKNVHLKLVFNPGTLKHYYG